VVYNEFVYNKCQTCKTCKTSMQCIIPFQIDYFTRCYKPPAPNSHISTSVKDILTSLALIAPSGKDSGHHLFLGNQVVDALQMVQKTLHVTAPLVQNIISVAGLGK